jgi:myo-inositol-1(or 4)-monophosphatase
MSAGTEPLALRAFIADLLQEAGERVARGFGTTGPLTFKRGREAITPIDSEVEGVLVTRIRTRFPEHRICGEERGESGARHSRWEWQLDPIDGTLNYSLGIPFFSVSIAVSDGGGVLAGGVIDPLRGELFLAARGSGAVLGQQRIHPSDRRTLSEAIVSTQLSSRGLFVREPALLQALHTRALKTRRLGTIALELAYVAAGRLDLLLAGKSVPQNIYDVAAGLLLVHEAGGRVTTGDGTPFGPASIELLASNGHVHDEALELLRPFLARRAGSGSAATTTASSSPQSTAPATPPAGGSTAPATPPALGSTASAVPPAPSSSAS